MKKQVFFTVYNFGIRIDTNFPIGMLLPMLTKLTGIEDITPNGIYYAIFQTGVLFPKEEVIENILRALTKAPEGYPAEEWAVERITTLPE